MDLGLNHSSTTWHLFPIVSTSETGIITYYNIGGVRSTLEKPRGTEDSAQ